MKKKLIAGIWMVIILSLAIAIIRPIVLDNARKVKFEDEKMGVRIGAYSKAKSMEEFRKENLEEVKNLDIRYTGYYDTLIDIEKCQQLRNLEIGETEYKPEYEEAPGPETKERIQQIETELESIMKKCQKLTRVRITGTENYFKLDDLEFLKNGKNLKYLDLFYQPAEDYSAISEIPHLKNLFFCGCKISKLDMLEGLNELEALVLKETDVQEAGEIVTLRALKKIEIVDTPLGGDEEQLEFILKNCPNIEELSLENNDELSSLEFLKSGKKLQMFCLTEQSLDDYSAIAACSQLKSLTLTGCDISDLSILNGMENLESLQLSRTNVSEAKNILELKKLKELYIVDTPLAEKEEELALIYQKFPDIEIRK